MSVMRITKSSKHRNAQARQTLSGAEIAKFVGGLGSDQIGLHHVIFEIFLF